MTLLKLIDNTRELKMLNFQNSVAKQKEFHFVLISGMPTFHNFHQFNASLSPATSF